MIILSLKPIATDRESTFFCSYIFSLLMQQSADHANRVNQPIWSYVFVNPWRLSPSLSLPLSRFHRVPLPRSSALHSMGLECGHHAPVCRSTPSNLFVLTTTIIVAQQKIHCKTIIACPRSTHLYTRSKCWPIINGSMMDQRSFMFTYSVHHHWCRC